MKVTTPTAIGNCRSIPAAPTDIAVVYTMLINIKKILNNLGQKYPCVTVDEAIYRLAKQVQWTVPSLEEVTIRLGGFHRAKNFCGVIGKHMKASGFAEILQNSELFGPNQIDGELTLHQGFPEFKYCYRVYPYYVSLYDRLKGPQIYNKDKIVKQFPTVLIFLGILDGKHYNRCIKTHKCMFEALQRSYWIEFEQWLKTEDMDYRLEHLTNALERLLSEFSTEKLVLELPGVQDKLQVTLFPLKSIFIIYQCVP